MHARCDVGRFANGSHSDERGALSSSISLSLDFNALATTSKSTSLSILQRILNLGITPNPEPLCRTIERLLGRKSRNRANCASVE